MAIKTEQSINFLEKEWESENGWHYSGDKMEKFNKIYDISYHIVQEMLQMSSCMHKEWLFFKHKEVQALILHDSKKLDEIWNKFKKEWNLFSNETNQMFKEMELLSEKLLQEWRYKYTYEFPHVYEKEDYMYSRVNHNKQRTTMWEEFKEIWGLEPQNYNEDFLEELLKDTENDFESYEEEWYEFLIEGNYHSYDSYSLLEKNEIWNYFISYVSL